MKTLLDKIISASKAGLTFIGSGLAIVKPQTKEFREKICMTCMQYEPNANKCLSCGCYLSIKQWMPKEVCPEGKWLEEEIS